MRIETSFLSIADDQAAAALRVMVNDNTVPFDGLKFAWARFMMSLLYRTPEGVARSMEMIRIETKRADFDPGTFVDHYEEAVVKMLQRKQAGMPVPKGAERRAASTNVVNLMDALRRSLATGRPAAKPSPKKPASARSTGAKRPMARRAG